LPTLDKSPCISLIFFSAPDVSTSVFVFVVVGVFIFMPEKAFLNEVTSPLIVCKNPPVSTYGLIEASVFSISDSDC